VGVPGKALHVVVGIIGTEIVQKEERIVLLRGTIADGTMQMDARAFDGGAALEDLKDASVLWHERLLEFRRPGNPGSYMDS
jgi:hypothetical protein